MVKSELLDSLNQVLTNGNQVFDDDSMTTSSIDYIDMVEIESEMLVSKQLEISMNKTYAPEIL